MLFDTSRKNANALLRKALRTKAPRDRDILIEHARKLNGIAIEAERDTAFRRAPAAVSATPELEAVARRMCLAFHLDWRGDSPTRWQALVDDQWPDFLVEAQAAIEALLAVSPDQEVRAYLRQAIGGVQRYGQTETRNHSAPAAGP
jgi:hypothetical protein